MLLGDIMLFLLTMTFMVMVWTAMFFAFDEQILKGHFKKKLQNYFGVEQ